jgi:WD40 repeat protein
LWRSGDWRPEKVLSVGTPVTSIAFLKDPNVIVVGGQQIQLWDCAASRSLLTVEVPRGPVRVLALNHTGDEMTVADQGHQVRVLDLRALRQQLKLVHLELP